MSSNREQLKINLTTSAFTFFKALSFDRFALDLNKICRLNSGFNRQMAGNGSESSREKKKKRTCESFDKRVKNRNQINFELIEMNVKYIQFVGTHLIRSVIVKSIESFN
jgi:hypothetical protein